MHNHQIMILSAEEQHTMIIMSSSSTLETRSEDSTTGELEAPDSRVRQKKHSFWATWMWSTKKRIRPTRKCDPSHVIKKLSLAGVNPLPLRSCLASSSSPLSEESSQRVKKSVTIKRGRPEKRKTMHLANYTKEEISSTWYSSAEIELFFIDEQRANERLKQEKLEETFSDIIAELQRECWQD